MKDFILSDSNLDDPHSEKVHGVRKIIIRCYYVELQYETPGLL